jgi:hypothetical protein
MLFIGLHMNGDVFNFTFDFSDDMFVRPKAPAKKVTDVDKLAGQSTVSDVMVS